MSKRMLIDASHPEETRVVVIDGNRVEEFDFEAAAKRPLKGNIYLAKVTRVEPSLQAAFVEYGGNRQGFLAFSEIHPDYYQIPVADRMAILQAQTERLMAEEDVEAIDANHADSASGGDDEGESDENSGAQPDEADESPGFHEVSSANEQFDAGPSSGGYDNPETPFTRETEQVSGDEPSERDDQRAAGRHDIGSPDTENPETAITVETVDAGAAGDAQGAALTGAFSVPPMNVQAETTGAPVAYQRREPSRQHDRPRPRRRQYKIQEVIKRRQVMLIQVVKEERGNKGASLTTFLSLAGRYCVLMPNTPRGGGISRKITNAADRKRLKSAAQSLDLPEGMGLIIRTAGANRTKTEIKRDYEYLLRLWDTVRELTLKSNAPALVYEEGSLIKRAIRDLYSKEISEIIVDGETGYREAKEFMRMLMPSHAKNVKLYREPLPLFQRLQVESQLDAMFSPVVHLKSGGYIVINQTEALVAIDVNSGRATREHSIEETAAKTNLEAADEIARQLRLRDLAGLIVIDFIDMEDSKNDRNVEKRLHNAVRNDRARIQIGRISQFGLLELSRQRLRAGVVAGSTITCPHCNGQGIIRSTESAALRLLRALDEEGQRQPSVNLSVKTPLEVAIYALNQKRREVARIEEAYDVAILFEPQQNMVSGGFEIQRTGIRVPASRPKPAAVSVEGGFHEAETVEPETDITIVEPPEAPVAAVEAAPDPDSAGTDARGRKRRRRRRGGRGRPGQQGPATGEAETPLPDRPAENLAQQPVLAADENDAEPLPSAVGPETSEQENGAGHAADLQSQSAAAESNDKRRRRRRRGRRGRRYEPDVMNATPNSPHEVSLQAEPGLAEAGNSAALPSTDAVFAQVPLFRPPEATGTPAGVMPNTPSSPVWSLLDQQVENAPTRRPVDTPETVVAVPMTTGERGSLGSVSLAAAPREQPVSPDEAGSPGEIGSPEEAGSHGEGAADHTPRETRRGWWQRRFKA